MKFDEAFIRRNKKALLEEISMHLYATRKLISNAALNPDALASSFVGIASEVGMVDAFFRQYMLFRSGQIPVPHPIGFKAFEDLDKEEELDDDDDDCGSETPSTT
jgi:hypothetical protein